MRATFNRPKDFRRIATRYDKLARNHASVLVLAAIVAFFAESGPDGPTRRVLAVGPTCLVGGDGRG